MKFKNNTTNNAKKLETEISWWKLSKSFLSLFNQLDQEGSGLKILTPKQMLSRLPISLA